MIFEFVYLFCHLFCPENSGKFTFQKQGRQRADTIKNNAHAEGNQKHGKNLGFGVARNLQYLAVSHGGQRDHCHVNAIQKAGLGFKENIVTAAACHDDQED